MPSDSAALNGLRAIVTGANRGLGLAFAGHLARAADTTTLLGFRQPGPVPHELRALGVGHDQTLQVDYSSAASLQLAAAAAADRLATVDLVINCGGINTSRRDDPSGSKGPIDAVSYDAVADLLAVNAVGPLFFCAQLWPLITRSPSAVIVNVTSGRGSLAGGLGTASIGYAVSKTALNMATRKIAASMPAGSAAVAVDPGWVRTRMGGPEAPNDPDDVAGEILRTLTRSGSRYNGRFIDRAGQDLPW